MNPPRLIASGGAALDEAGVEHMFGEGEKVSNPPSRLMVEVEEPGFVSAAAIRFHLHV